MRHYCTLFDSKYLPRGLVLYESLREHSSEPFTLWILAMDTACSAALHALVNVSNVNICDYANDPAVVKCADGRTWQEVCWTQASQLTEQILTAYDVPEITYLDADMMFFSDPEVIFKEIGRKSIAVIPHRFIPEKKYLEVNGRFNVSWVTFRNTPAGVECLKIWAAQCRKRCSATYGCGDQLYLDEWPDKYGNEVHIIDNIGAGLAPWNLANYHLHWDEYLRVDGQRVVFYHYHEFTELEDGNFRLTNYPLREEDIVLIYEPYLRAYQDVRTRIARLHLPS